MTEFLPYITNDGSVGLFSKEDDDIYHSTYGAFSEAYEKFILPSEIETHILNKKDIKILDICFGIGYNSKSFLNKLIEKFITIETIHTNNIFNKILSFIKEKRKNYNGAIGSDNILTELLKNSFNNQREYISSIDSDKISHFKDYSITIDAVDTNKFLMSISPFLKSYSKETFGYTNERVKKLLNRYTKEKYYLHKEVDIILLIKLLESNKDLLKDKNLRLKLKDGKFSRFFDKEIISLAKFLEKEGYKHKGEYNKTGFLHNIYYQYISNCYKNSLKILNLLNISFSFSNEDARNFILQRKSTYDFIFLDAFTPAKCPILWSTNFFKELYNHLSDDGQILTYSNSAAVRNAFSQNGFFVGKIYNIETKKFTGTIACKNKSLIKYPLDNYDIGLINSKAGIVYRDDNLSLDCDTILKNREIEVENSNLISSTKFIKGYKNGL